MSEFDAFAAEKSARAAEATIGSLVTVDERPSACAERIGNGWTREHYGGSFCLLPFPSEVPAVSVVMVRSRNGNTVAPNPADLGGGDTDLHLIYEGLSRVAADGVLAGSATARGRVFFSLWHPELVELRDELGMPRHPAQIVISRSGHLALDRTLLFNVPDVPVFVIAGPECRERCRADFNRRPWLTVMPWDGNDLVPCFADLRRRGIRRISAVGGRRTASALVDAGLVQDLCLTTSSQPGGEPETPWYAGRRVLDLRPIVRKRSADGQQLPPIAVDHLEIGAVR